MNIYPHLGQNSGARRLQCLTTNRMNGQKTRSLTLLLHPPVIRHRLLHLPRQVILTKSPNPTMCRVGSSPIVTDDDEENPALRPSNNLPLAITGIPHLVYIPRLPPDHRLYLDPDIILALVLELRNELALNSIQLSKLLTFPTTKLRRHRKNPRITRMVPMWTRKMKMNEKMKMNGEMRCR
jgi:hypothetical protein